MGLSEDLTRERLAPLLGDRALRTFPAMLSTEQEALAWARQGGPHGAAVVTGYVAAPRGRSGLDWDHAVRDGRGFACSVVLRPDLAETEEGWPYTVACTALLDVLGTGDGDVRFEWPDHLVDDDGPVAAVGVQSEPAGSRLRWVVATMLAFRVEPPRGETVAALLAALDTRLAAPREQTVDDARGACATLGRRVQLSLLPMGPESPAVTGEAVDLTTDGGLVVHDDDEGRRVVVLPQAVGTVTDPADAPTEPPGIG